jgi:chaperonin GroEL (HSP60 family)
VRVWSGSASAKPRLRQRRREEPRHDLGVALLRAGKALDKLKGENEDQRHGIEMVKKALSWPARQIAINAGEDGSVVVGKIQDNDT